MMVLKDLVQRLDAVIQEAESSGVLLTRRMSSSTTDLGIMPTQSCPPPVASIAQVRVSRQTLKQSWRF